MIPIAITMSRPLFRRAEARTGIAVSIPIISVSAYCTLATRHRRQSADDQTSILANLKRPPGDFPQISVRIGEVAAISTPRCLTRRLLDSRPRSLSLLEHTIHILLSPNVVCQGDPRDL